MIWVYHALLIATCLTSAKTLTPVYRVLGPWFHNANYFKLFAPYLHALLKRFNWHY
jgi:hypothetical protein